MFDWYEVGSNIVELLDLESIGSIAARRRVPVDALRLAADAAGVRPALTLDGVPYFRAAEANRLTIGGCGEVFDALLADPGLSSHARRALDAAADRMLSLLARESELAGGLLAEFEADGRPDLADRLRRHIPRRRGADRCAAENEECAAESGEGGGNG